jgi:thiol-disulfide isomerase/thioredoxin
MRKCLLVSAAGLICLLIATACSRGAERPEEGLEVGNTFPHYQSFAAQTIDGQDFKLSDSKGKHLFIDFWATWCVPCEDELPYLKRIHEKYVGDKFAMVGISLDQSIPTLRQGTKAFGIEYPQICDEKGWQSKYAKMFSIQSIPANFLLDGNGVIIAKDLRGLAGEGRVAKVLGRDEPIVHYVATLDYLESSDQPDIAKAQGLLAPALEADPDEPEFHFLAGQLKAAGGDHAGAIEEFRTGLKHVDKLPVFRPALMAYVGIAQSHLLSGDAEKAGAALDELVEAINALEGDQKRMYGRYIPEIHKLKRQWLSAAKQTEEAKEAEEE